MEEDLKSKEPEGEEKILDELKPTDGNLDQAQNHEDVKETPSQESIEADGQMNPVEPALQSDQHTRDESVFSTQKRHFGRNVLVGLGIVVFAFLAGFLVDHFVRYQPMKTALTSDVQALNNELAQAKQSLSELESNNGTLSGSLSTANDRIASLEGENTILQANLNMANLHIELLQTLADFNSANIALAKQDVSGAKVALINTAERIETLKPLIGTVDAVLAENLLSRFSLVLSTMETDPETARTDLDLLTKNILNVEKLVFAP